MVVNVVALAPFAVNAVVSVPPVAVVRVLVAAVVGTRAGTQRRDMASPNFPSRFRSGRELPPRRSRDSYLIYNDGYLILRIRARARESDFDASKGIFQRTKSIKVYTHIMNLREQNLSVYRKI